MKKILLTCYLSILIVFGVNAQLANYSQIHISEGTIFTANTEVINNSNLTNKGALELKSNLINNAVLSSGGVLIFSGEKMQQISGRNAAEVARLTVKNDILLNTTLKIKEELELESGYVYTGEGAVLELGKNAGYSNAGNMSHVAGVMTKVGNGSFTFPVGDGFSMRSFYVEDLGGSKVTVSYVAESPMALSVSMDEVMESINEREYWHVRSEAKEGTVIKLTNCQLVYLRSDIWTPAPDILWLDKEGFMFTFGNSRKVVKSIGVWPNPTDGIFSLSLTGMKDDDDIQVDILHQDGRIVRHLEGKVKELRKIYTLPADLATTSLKVRVVNNGEVLTQTLVLNK